MIHNTARKIGGKNLYFLFRRACRLSVITKLSYKVSKDESCVLGASSIKHV